MKPEFSVTLAETDRINNGIDLLWAPDPECNLRCKYCYFGNPENHFNWRTFTNVSEQDHFTFAQRLEGSYVKRVTIAGGDPTQIPYLPSLIQTLSQEGINTAISTNGLLLDKELVTDLSQSGLNTIFLSIDSPTPEYHDSMRGHWKDSIDALHRAVWERDMQNNNLKVGVYMVVTLQNVNMISSMARFVADQGADYFEFQPVSLHQKHSLFNSLDFCAQNANSNLFLDQIKSLYSSNLSIALPSDVYIDTLTEIMRSGSLTVTNCFGGKSLFFINPLGDIWPCPSGRRKTEADRMGNIKHISEEDFQSLFNPPDKTSYGNSCGNADRDCVCMFDLKSSAILK